MVEQSDEEAKELIDTTLEQAGDSFNRASGLALKKAVKAILMLQEFLEHLIQKHLVWMIFSST